MGVQKDAGELLFFVYDELINIGKSEVKAQDVFDETGWEAKRINLAYDYLNKKSLLKGFGGSRDGKSLLHFPD